MSKFHTIKGTHDLLPEYLQKWKKIKIQVERILTKHGYSEIRTPSFETTELFIRGVGTDTDIVNKEMYSWIDQGGNELTLKPELTAPVVRAYLQHNLGSINPLHRMYYFDTLFRRERPQKGRQRQFYQFGAEAIGSQNPEQDAEIISMAFQIFKSFGIKEIKVHINSIGSFDIRETYLDLLRKKIVKFSNSFCKVCESRLNKNSLRVFDCKNSKCQEILDVNAPLIFDSISREDKQHFNMVIEILNELKIPFIHDKKLVRGLDYYSHTTFEITSSLLGSQDALCGGGRYNGLIEQLGGKSTPAVGFAAGMERLMMAIGEMHDLESNPDIYVITMGDEANVQVAMIAHDIREKCDKIVIVETLRRSLKSQMREANRVGAKFVIIIGEEELKNKMVIIKDMKSSQQLDMHINDLVDFFKR